MPRNIQVIYYIAAIIIGRPPRGGFSIIICIDNPPFEILDRSRLEKETCMVWELAVVLRRNQFTKQTNRFYPDEGGQAKMWCEIPLKRRDARNKLKDLKKSFNLFRAIEIRPLRS